MSSNESFLQSVLAELGPIQPFKPTAYYDSDGDCIEFLFSNEPFFARRLDGWVTVYYSEETQDVVGGLIKGVRKNLLTRYPGLQIEIEDNEANVACFLRAPAYETGDAVKQKTYQAVIKRAEETDCKAELAAMA